MTEETGLRGPFRDRSEERVQRLVDRLNSLPVDRYGEEAVENTAARLLGGWRDEEVYNVLLRLLRRKPMPGVIETIGEYRRTEGRP